GPLTLLFLGRLDWPPNQEGLVWFLKEVWPEVVKGRTDLKLLIAGSGNSEFLKPFLSVDFLTFLGRVESVKELYRKVSLSLVPIFYGSGTRVKVIEACSYGRACLSTALGVEGTGLESGISYLRAETAQEWIEMLRSLRSENVETIGSSAHEALKS